ncbi:hypothetical protein BDD30_1785 [Photorhabdus asymbiotica]|uniref:Uncharacterized protein n=1 Tax=Photorhabdus asymbiotica TaxID=291112 RepID=A0ABX9SNW6_9GAMM|nr:hypothetical protein BDD30_1785 [Photorhabdus asymbiotica]
MLDMVYLFPSVGVSVFFPPDNQKKEIIIYYGYIGNRLLIQDYSYANYLKSHQLLS